MEKQSVHEFCSTLLDQFFSNGAIVINKYPELSPFKHNRNSLLKLVANEESFVPMDPDNSFPRLLLWNLENPDHEKSPVYKYLESVKRDIPSALYATSGAGKTRRIFEYLSLNTGFYFLVKKSSVDPGSRDFWACYHLGVELKGDSKENYLIVQRNMFVLIYVRFLVYGRLSSHLGRKPTPYEWLLLQLYPSHFMAGDVFEKLATACIRGGMYGQVDLRTTMGACYKLNLDLEEVCSCLFVDESQKLLEGIDTGTFVSSDGVSSRSSFSAVLKGLMELHFLLGVFPTFSGTGMPINEIKEATNFPMAKFLVAPRKETIFTELDHLDTNAIQAYLDLFVDFGNVSEEVKRHLCRWLRGRPRWTATFLELYMVKEPRSIQFGTRGKFNEYEARVVQALDRYLANMTEAKNKEGPGKRNSRPIGDPRTAYAAFERVMKQSNEYSALKCLEDLVFRYAVTGEATYIQVAYKKVIENGLASVRQVEQTDENKDGFEGVLNEPMIIQAGINYFAIAKRLEQELNLSDDKGLAFEKLMLPYLQKNLRGIIETQLGQKNVFNGFHLSSKSCYGVLATSCKQCDKEGVQCTFDWITMATNARIEGTYPPFCFPDNCFGSDVLFLLWSFCHLDFRVVLSQAKYRPDFNQTEALRTMVPCRLYMNKRGAKEDEEEQEPQEEQEPKRKKTLNKGKRKQDETGPKKKNSEGNGPALNSNVPANEWEIARKVLLKDKKPCLRLMVQYPMKATRSAMGWIMCHQDAIDKCDCDTCDKVHDFLVTVDSTNAPQLFEKVVFAMKGSKQKGRYFTGTEE